MIESKKAPSKLNTALSIGVLPFLLCAQAAHGLIDDHSHFVAVQDPLFKGGKLCFGRTDDAKLGKRMANLVGGRTG
jgi:hypothetical protein